MALGRVVLGGLVAGVLLVVGETGLNQIVLAEEWAALAVDQAPLAGAGWRAAAIAGVLLLYGVVLVWLYAAIRPRFGAGPRTAIVAGPTLWTISWLLLGVSLSLSGMVTLRIAGISALWGAVEVPLAALAGASMYRERAS